MNEITKEMEAEIAAGVAQLCSRSWWVFLIGGIASVIFGVMAFTNPGIALLIFGALGVFVGAYALAVPPISMIALIYVIAFFALVNGLTSLFLGWKVRKEISTEWILYLSGGLSVLFALLVLFQPAVGGIAIAYVIGTWAVIVGLLRIYFAFFARNLQRTA